MASKEYYYDRIKKQLNGKEGVLLTDFKSWGKKQYSKIEVHCKKCSTDFITTASSLNRGRFSCPDCQPGGKKLSWTKVIEIGKNRGLKCLSKESEYKNSHTPLAWLCKKGHNVFMRVNTLSRKKRYHSCSICNEYSNENFSRYLFELFTEKHFGKVRPSWLKSNKLHKSSGRRTKLELDGYNAGLKIAFEYHGKQHYEYLKFFFSNKDAFYYLKECDKIVLESCKNQGINLIVIPYTVDPNNLPKFIYSKISEYQKLNNFDEYKIDYTNRNKTDYLVRCKKIAEERGGFCKSNYYINNKYKLEFVCKNSHEFKMTPQALFSGQWCGKLICKFENHSVSKEEIIQNIKKYHELTGKLNSNKYELFIRKNKLRGSLETIRKKFGGWKKALRDAEFIK
jgi:hypothetical protein